MILIPFFVESLQDFCGHGRFPSVRCAWPSALVWNACGVFAKMAKGISDGENQAHISGEPHQITILMERFFWYANSHLAAKIIQQYTPWLHPQTW